MNIIHKKSFVCAQFVVVGDTDCRAFVFDYKLEKQTSDTYAASDPYEALAALAHRLCRNCHKRDRDIGEKYCQPCRQVVIQRLARGGYFDPVPKMTERSHKGFCKHVNENEWDDIVNAMEHAMDGD